MAKPRASAGTQKLDFMSLLQQMFNGAFAPGDGLKNFAAPSAPSNLWGPDLVKYWSSQDLNTPDKLTPKGMRNLAAQYPGSPFANSYTGLGGGARNVGGATQGAFDYATFKKYFNL